jgi:hypothetical protein
MIVGKLFRQCLTEGVKATEESEDGQKSLFIEGIFCQADVLNNNQRVYPDEILDSAVKEYIDQKVKSNRALGELGHPDSPKINLDKVCIKIEKLDKNGSNWNGRAKVLTDTPSGAICRGLINGGVNFGVSTRGLGSADKGKWKNEEANLVNNFVLRAIDVVSDPSAPDAYVSAIEEEKEYILDSLSGEIYDMNEETYKMFENRLKVLPVRKSDRQVAIFEGIQNFLNSLRASK